MRPVVLLLACVVATGCTTAVSGTPSAPSGVLLPPRPREVRLDGVDPCSLLTAEQRAELGLTSEPRASTSYVKLFRGDVSSCSITGPSPESILLGITTVTTVGIERWQEDDVAAELTATTAQGFPALVVQPRQYRDYCSVEIDIAAGQLLDVQYGSGSLRTPIAQDELCRRAEQSAEQAVATLLSR